MMPAYAKLKIRGILKIKSCFPLRVYVSLKIEVSSNFSLSNIVWQGVVHPWWEIRKTPIVIQQWQNHGYKYLLLYSNGEIKGIPIYCYIAMAKLKVYQYTAIQQWRNYRYKHLLLYSNGEINDIPIYCFTAMAKL